MQFQAYPCEIKQKHPCCLLEKPPTLHSLPQTAGHLPIRSSLVLLLPTPPLPAFLSLFWAHQLMLLLFSDILVDNSVIAIIVLHSWCQKYLPHQRCRSYDTSWPDSGPPGYQSCIVHLGTRISYLMQSRDYSMHGMNPSSAHDRINADLLSITRKLIGRVIYVACTINRAISSGKTLVLSKATR